MAGTGLQGSFALQSLDDLVRQRMMDRELAPPSSVDPLSTEYDAWLAQRPKELGR